MSNPDPISVFRTEAAECLEQIEAGLLDLTHDLTDRAQIDAVFRETAVRLAFLWAPVEELVNALLMEETVSGPLAARIIRSSHPGPALE